MSIIARLKQLNNPAVKAKETNSAPTNLNEEVFNYIIANEEQFMAWLAESKHFRDLITKLILEVKEKKQDMPSLIWEKLKSDFFALQAFWADPCKTRKGVEKWLEDVDDTNLSSKERRELILKADGYWRSKRSTYSVKVIDAVFDRQNPFGLDHKQPTEQIHRQLDSEEGIEVVDTWIRTTEFRQDSKKLARQNVASLGVSEALRNMTRDLILSTHMCPTAKKACDLLKTNQGANNNNNNNEEEIAPPRPRPILVAKQNIRALPPQVPVDVNAEDEIDFVQFESDKVQNLEADQSAPTSPAPTSENGIDQSIIDHNNESTSLNLTFNHSPSVTPTPSPKRTRNRKIITEPSSPESASEVNRNQRKTKKTGKRKPELDNLSTSVGSGDDNDENKENVTNASTTSTNKRKRVLKVKEKEPIKVVATRRSERRRNKLDD